MASHTGKRRSLFGIDNAVYSESDAETISYDYDESSDDGENLSSDEFSSDSEVSESESDLLQDVRVWCAIDVEHPPAAPPRFPFTGQPGLQVPLNDEQDPLTYVRLFLDEDIMISIVTETNRYAEQTLTRTPHRPLSLVRETGSQLLSMICGCFSALSYCRESCISRNNAGTGPPTDCWRHRFLEKS